MKTLNIPSNLNLVDFVNKIKSAIQSIFEISDISHTADRESKAYYIYSGSSPSPLITINYEIVSEDDSEKIQYTTLQINEEHVDADLIRTFLIEIGFDEDEINASMLSEFKNVVLKRGMLSAFQKSLLESKKKKRKCKKCGFISPTYRGSRSKCPICSYAMGADSIIWPYKAVELSSDRGAESTGAPPPPGVGASGSDSGGAAIGESSENNLFVVVLKINGKTSEYYTAGINKKTFTLSAWSSYKEDATRFSQVEAELVEQMLIDNMSAIAKLKDLDEDDIEIIATKDITNKKSARSYE